MPRFVTASYVPTTLPLAPPPLSEPLWVAVTGVAAATTPESSESIQILLVSVLCGVLATVVVIFTGTRWSPSRLPSWKEPNVTVCGWFQLAFVNRSVVGGAATSSGARLLNDTVIPLSGLRVSRTLAVSCSPSAMSAVAPGLPRFRPDSASTTDTSVLKRPVASASRGSSDSTFRSRLRRRRADSRERWSKAANRRADGAIAKVPGSKKLDQFRSWAARRSGQSLASPPHHDQPRDLARKRGNE